MTAVPSTVPTLQILHHYIDLGFALIPIWWMEDGVCACPDGPACDRSRGKHPIGHLAKNGVNSASRDKNIVAGWLKRCPKANWAVRSGVPVADGRWILCVDVDPRNGGDKTIEGLRHTFDETWTQDTGGSGTHYIFYSDVPPASWGNEQYPGIDFIGDGKYFCVYPSVHESGRQYTWALGQSPDDVLIAKTPSWALQPADGAARPARNVQGASARSTVLGELFRLAGLLGNDMADGSVAVTCPWFHEHSDGRGRGTDSSTVIFPPAGGSDFGGWKCQHAHCAQRTWKDVFERMPEEWKDKARRKYPLRAVTEEDARVPSTERVVPARPNLEGETDEDALRRRIEDCRSRCAFDNNGKILKNVVNLVTILSYDPRWEGILTYDAFRHTIILNRQPQWHPDDAPAEPFREWTDDATNCLDMWIRRYWLLELSIDKILQAVNVVAKRDSVNPLQNYLEKLEWDGTSRVNEWLQNHLGAADTPYHRIAGRKWLISAVARAYQPGCKADYVLILEGPQGKGKSTALEVLASPGWFSDTPIDIGNKDAYLALRGKWIVELGELASLRRADLDRAKAFFSSRNDHYRPPYGRISQDFPRQCIFGGSINPDVNGYLTDPTGNRRFWPVACGFIDIEGLRENRDQIWAECVHLYKEWVARGSNTDECLWWPTIEETPIFAGEQIARTPTSAWAEPVAKWLRTKAATSRLKHRGFLTATEVLTEAIQINAKDFSRETIAMMGRTLKQLGWKQLPALDQNGAICFAPTVPIPEELSRRSESAPGDLPPQD